MPNELPLHQLPYIKRKIMECPRGSETTSSQHEVKTMDKAIEWCGGMVENMYLPLTIHQDKTTGGRIRVKIFNDKGCLILERG